ncbi:hypothetical protein Sango_2819100 [Sesamum angolense]|uniref:Uncharacterized protein n=1 Tax=Sesamum angolense TaxID=2727404 RepID=A0AAE1T6V5_9LAMI|nr:hypothetical protein Sango_2819100 [Sesamum angolense]
MLVQYNVTTHKYAPAVLVGEASTSKANSKRFGCWKTKKGKRKVVTTTAKAEGAPTAPKGNDKGKGKAAKLLTIAWQAWVLKVLGSMGSSCIRQDASGRQTKFEIYVPGKRFPTDSQQDEVLLEESSEAPQQNNATSFKPLVPTDGVPVLLKSTRESRPPERYGFIGLTNPLKGVRPVGCKWVYKRKPRVDSEVTAFKARLVAKKDTLNDLGSILRKPTRP